MSTKEISTEDKLKKLEGKFIQVFKQLNTIQKTVVLNVTMVDNLRIINIELIGKIGVLQRKVNVLEGKVEHATILRLKEYESIINEVKDSNKELLKGIKLREAENVPASKEKIWVDESQHVPIQKRVNPNLYRDGEEEYKNLLRRVEHLELMPKSGGQRGNFE